MMESHLELMAHIHKAFAYPVQGRILATLRSGEVCACQLNAVIGLAPSTISAHLGELRDAGLVAERKAGRCVHYRLAAKGAAGKTLTTPRPAIEKDTTIAADQRVLRGVTSLPTEAICRPDCDPLTLRAACCEPTHKKGKISA
jgi:ArsR family transcriptional regulator